MKRVLSACLALAAAGAFAVTPGKVLRMVPQSGISKSFDIFTENAVVFRVQFYSPEVFRILASLEIEKPLLDRAKRPVKKDGKVVTYKTADFSDPRNNPDRAQILVGIPEDKTRVVFADNRAAGTLTFSTSILTLTVNKSNGTFSLAYADGTPIWAEAEPLDLGKKETRQTLATNQDEFFYGGGQQNGYLSHKGRKIEIRADGNWGEGGHPNPAPWYMSNKGYGVLRHTFSTGIYDFSAPDKIVTSHRENRFDAFYFVGHDFGGTLNLYTKYTGRPNFIPMWGLQLGDADAYITRDRKTKDPAQNEDGSFKEVTPVDAVRVAKSYRENNMPGGWLLVNDGYGCGHMQLGYTVDALASLGFHTGLWTEGALDRIKWEVGKAGTRVQKLDVAWSGPAYQHGLQCNKYAAEGIENNSNARSFIWTVQGWAGTQRYGVCWTGDQYGSWDLIRYHIPTLTCSSMSGQAYATTDVDGIFGGSDETYCRDLQWKCWTTCMYVMNGWSHKNKGPWSYPEPYKSINRKFLLHKNRMVPYVYTYMRSAWDNGSPVVRPLVYNYPKDRKTWGEETKYQYMLGADFLIAPVYNAMKINRGWKKNIYLPEGEWIDYSDGRRVKGGQTLAAYPITLDKLPIFVRKGAIIPMYPEMLVLGDKPYDPLTFDIYPDRSGEANSFTVYEDDGSTREYQQGAYSTQRITTSTIDGERCGLIRIDLEGATGSFDGMLEKRGYEFVVHTRAKPLSVVFLKSDRTVGQEVLDVNGAAAETLYRNGRQCWYYNAGEKYGTLRIRVDRRSVRDSLALLVRTAPFSTIRETPAYPVPVVTPEIDKSEFVVTANSWAGDCPARNAFDGTPETMWHSYWNAKRPKYPLVYPYVINVDMKGLYPVNSLGYTPRSNLGNGVVKGYKIELARFPGKFEKSLEGEFKPFKKAVAQEIAIPTTWARYLRITFTSPMRKGDTFGSAAEIDIGQDLKVKPLPDEVRAIGKHKISVDGSDYPACRLDKVGASWTLDLDGTWEKVKGHAGMLTKNSNKGNVTFRIYADGKQIFARVGMKPGDVKQLIDVDIPVGAKQLRFTLSKDEGGADSDTGVWTDLHLFRAGSEK